jgi:hypothetical protein
MSHSEGIEEGSDFHHQQQFVTLSHMNTTPKFSMMFYSMWRELFLVSVITEPSWV